MTDAQKLKNSENLRTLELVSLVNDDTVRILSHLYSMANSGLIKSICFTAQGLDQYTHYMGYTAEYKRDPNIALIPIERLYEEVINRARSMEKFTELSVDESI